MLNLIVFFDMAKLRVSDEQIKEEDVNNPTDLVFFIHYLL